jgi:hypothetical protein
MAGDIQEFDFSVNLLRAILWQYNGAANLQGILNRKSDWYNVNQMDFWNDWYADVFNLATANDFGLNVWAIILGQSIYVNNPPDGAEKPCWGLGPYNFNFDRGNFANNGGSTYQLPTEAARILLRLRYFQLTSSGTVPETNRMLKYVFGNLGQAWLEDGLNMTQRYYFGFALSVDLIYLFTHFDVLPRPAGVESSFYQGTVEYFGLGPYHANFTRGNFGD